uniref:Uncharacterized protein n=1 Tax=Physcomitrium patens TaxID=3218 RepID=A0A2K1JPL1_PHYPA|nr:hypothetical protein PHYPA_015864 [Physcomitrium patens]
MPYLPKNRDMLRVRGGRGAATLSTSRRCKNAERQPSQAKNAEMTSCGSGHESPAYEKSSIAYEGTEGGDKDHGGQVECTGTSQEVMPPKSRTQVISKHKLAKHAAGGRTSMRAEDETDYENFDGFRTGYGDECVESDSLKHSHLSRKKQHEDHQRHESRSNGLQEWKGDFVGNSERMNRGFDEDETPSDSPATASQLTRKHSIEGRVDNRPASAPRRMQGGLAYRKSKEAGENLDDVEIKKRESRVFLGATVEHDKLSFLVPELQRGMKEDCEHFRQEMRLLKEKAQDSRIREVGVEGLTEISQLRLVDEIDFACVDPSRIKHNRGQAPRDIANVCAVHGTVRASPCINRFRGGYTPVNHGALDPAAVHHDDQPGRAHPPQTSPSVTASGSTSGSSGTSLPLSHYIQKLKNFSPDSQLGSTNREWLSPVNKPAREGSNHCDYQEKVTLEDTEELPTSNEPRNGSSDSSATPPLSGGSASAILVPASANSSNSSRGIPRSQSRLANRFGPVRTSTLYASLAHPTPLASTTKFKSSQVDSGYIALLNSNPKSHHEHEEKAAATFTTFNDQVPRMYFQRDIENHPSLEGKDDKMNNVQRLLGELKGSVEGMEIRLEIDGQGWRGRLDGLEKVLENMREEADDEIIAAKHSLRNEMKVKLGDLMAEMEKIRRQERNEVEVMMEERIEKQLQSHRDTKSSVETGDEVRLLWAEVEALVKSREEMQRHVEHLTSIAQKAQEHADREHDMLKTENEYLRQQLQSLKNDGAQIRLETEDFRVEREDLRLAVDMLRREGSDVKLEIQSRKQVEKLIEVELGNIRSELAKLQEEIKDMERQKGASQIEGGRERVLIMERVESLSQLYLGGLEGLRADFCDVKFNCRDRIQEFENKWKEFQKHQPEESTFATKQMLVDELDHFRGEIAEMVEVERGILRHTLDRESDSVHRQVKELLFNSKGDFVSVLKLDVQKWLQGHHEKVFVMTESLKQDLDNLKNKLCRTQEGAEDLIQIISAAEVQRDLSAAAAADASLSAKKASESLMDVTTNINSEMTTAHHRIKQFQENLTVEYNVVVSAMREAQNLSKELQREKEAALEGVQEARQRQKELQDFLEKEGSKLLITLTEVQKERDTASQAALEATSSATKAAEVLAQIMDSYNLEMAKARVMSIELQTEESISGLAAMVKELQEYRNYYSEEKKRRMVLKQQENKRKEQQWNGEISEINQVVRVVEKRVLEVCGDHTEIRKRLKKCEGAQMDLVHTVEEVSSTTNELAKTVSGWLPKYESAARMVNNLSCKVELAEEKLEGLTDGQSLAEHISRVAETKVQGLKEVVLSSAAIKDIGQDLRDLHEHVESSDRDHCQAIGEVAMRVTVLERTISHGPAGQPSPRLSLKVEYVDNAEARKPGMGSLCQNVEALERKAEFMTEHTGTSVGGHELATDSRLLGLESRIEHVASATFTNLRLLDSKVDRVSLGMQSAVEGAALAESKCGALGAELVKVFRMLTACKNPTYSGSLANRQKSNIKTRRGRSLSPPALSPNPQLDSRSQSPRIRSNDRRCNNKALFSPTRRPRVSVPSNRLKGGAGQKRAAMYRNITQNEKADMRKTIVGSDSGKMTTVDQVEGHSTCSGASEEGSSPNKTISYYLRTSLHDPFMGCKLHTQESQQAVHDRPESQASENPFQLKPRSPLEERPGSGDKPGKPNSALRLGTARMHVNVTHRSPAVSQSQKRENLIAVQS